MATAWQVQAESRPLRRAQPESNYGDPAWCDSPARSEKEHPQGLRAICIPAASTERSKTEPTAPGTRLSRTNSAQAFFAIYPENSRLPKSPALSTVTARAA